MTPVRLTRRSVLTLPLVPAILDHPVLAQEATPAPADGPTAEWRMFGANAARTGAVTGPGLTTAPVERWRLPTNLSQQPSPLGPLVAEGTVFLWTWSDQRLHALDSTTGTERWQADIGAAATAGSGADLNAASADGVLYIVGTAGEIISSDAGAPLALFALDPSSGQEHWRVSFPEQEFISALAVVGSRLVFSREGPSGNAISALDTASGQEVWRVPLPLSRVGISGGVAATMDTVYLPGIHREASAGVLFALDLATGTERWQAPTVGSPRYGPVVAEGSIFLASYTDDMSGTTVEALDAEAGSAR
jgi:eukaryotic-like serine/threonine-protein kinase